MSEQIIDFEEAKERAIKHISEMTEGMEGVLYLHDGAGYPRVGAGHKLAKQLQVDTCRIATCRVATVVVDAHIVHIVGHQVVQELLVHLGRELEVAVAHAELVVARKDEV